MKKILFIVCLCLWSGCLMAQEDPVVEEGLTVDQQLEYFLLGFGSYATFVAATIVVHFAKRGSSSGDWIPYD